MWLLGTLLFVALSATVVLGLGWQPRAVQSPPPWDISAVGAGYTGIVGTLAGFSIASAIFIAGLSGARASPVFSTLIGMLLIAFLILVFSALILASTPNIPADGDAVTQTLAHFLANFSGCLGLTVSWLALVPLLDLLGLPSLGDVFAWLLLFVSVTGSGWVAVFTYLLTRASVRACLAIPVLGLLFAAIYWVLATRFLSPLWPMPDSALRFSFVAFGLAGACLAIHSSLLATHGSKAVHRWLVDAAHRLALALSASYSLVVAHIWFAVAML
jgi:hypothetical protein